MRVSFYNQMFGMNGHNLISFLFVHWRVHFQRFFRKEINFDINKTIEIIKKSKSDIIGVAEVLEGQEKEIIEKLNKIGYNYVFFEKGHKTKFRKSYVKVMVVSKVKCRKINVKGFPVKNEMGGGGGFIHCYISSLKLNVINLHLACVKKDVYTKQLDFIEKYVSGLSNKIILL